jgi:uncharacterized membrane protein YbhN (UPF0104 family)
MTATQVGLHPTRPAVVVGPLGSVDADDSPTRVWIWVRLLGGAAVLAIVAWRLGTGPFVDGVRLVTGWSLACGAGIAVLTTICCAWRWSLVSRGLGAPLPLRAAVAAYYRSQFLNTMLPGGVLGDVHRAVRHGREAGDVGRSVRAVAAERAAGQAVQLLLTTVVLLALPSPVRSFMPAAAAGLFVLLTAALLVARSLPRTGPGRSARAVRVVVADLHHGLFARHAWPGVALASVLVVAGHSATFLLAAHTAGSTASPAQLLPLALLVLLAMGIPVTIGGWGPREGVAASVFAAAGFGAGQGVATAVVYGVITVVAYLPGLAVLIVMRVRRG